MQNIVQLTGNIHELRNIVLIEVEIFIWKQMLDIPELAGDKIIHTDHIEPFFYKAIT
jgi:hypothetical protein